jgi:hypothetical protein
MVAEEIVQRAGPLKALQGWRGAVGEYLVVEVGQLHPQLSATGQGRRFFCRLPGLVSIL